MPFASASIGKSYRNEISPRSGLLRVREFLMAEIEHFVDPQGGKKHRRFDEIASVQLPLLDRETQLSGNTTTKLLAVGDAVSQKVVDNETLGYFLARIYQFQFHRALCKAAGFTGPLDQCSIYGKKEAGEKLRAMLALGASKPWQDALYAISGERRADASAMIEFYAPLRAWIKDQIKGEQCGW